MKRMKLLVWLILPVMVLSLLAACSEEEQEVELEQIVLSEVIHSVFYTPQYVALNKGFFEDEGLDVSLEVAWGADKGAAALLSNSAQIALFGVEAAIYTLKENADNPIVAFAQLTQRDGSFLIGRQEEPDFDWQSLKGKTVVGGRQGGMPQMVLEWIMKQHGVTPHEDVEIIQNIQLSATGAAFAEGTGDYVQLWEPGGTQLENEGKGFTVASLGEDSGLIPYTVYHATEQYIAKNPETVQRFTNAIYRAQQWCEEHSAEDIADAVMPNHFEEFEKDTLVKVIEKYKEIGVWDTNPLLEAESLDLMQDIMLSYGTITEKVPFSRIVNNNFAEEAMK